MGRVQGKVAFITGAARGQGRSHAVRLAEEGADIIAVDLCENIDTIGYPMATADDLDETAAFVEKTGQRIVTAKADVRDAAQLKKALEEGIAQLGGLDIVVAQAGIAGMKGDQHKPGRHDQRHPGCVAPSQGGRIDRRHRLDRRAHGCSQQAESGQ